MKEITVKAFQFSELRKGIQDRIHHNYLNNFVYDESGEAGSTRDAFENYFDLETRSRDNSLRPCQEHIDATESMSPLRLRTWIINKYWNYLWESKFICYKKGFRHYSSAFHTTHYRGTDSTKICSSLFVTEGETLTGVCYDNSILEPIREFIKKPFRTSWGDLVDDCYHSWLDCIKSEEEHETSFEYFLELEDNSDNLYTIDGKLLVDWEECADKSIPFALEC